MTKSWISDGKQRASERYRILHARLAAEIAEERISRQLVERHNRSVRATAEYRRHGAP